MALKYTTESLDGIEEPHKALYVKDGDVYRLDVDGAVPKEKLDEFRNNNIKILKERDAANAKLAKYGDATPEEIAELKTEVETLKANKGGALNKEQIEAEVDKRLKKFRTEHDATVTTLKGDNDKLNARLSTLLVDAELNKVALETGAIDTAIDDVLERGRKIFKMFEGKVVPKNGEDILYGKSGDPLTMKEWVTELATKAPHLFKASSGGGAGGGNKGGGTGKFVIDNKPVKTKADLTSALMKSKFITEFGQKAYEELPRQAQAA